ncbi:GFA family protein [Sphingomonas sp. DT-204]|uniref:GFA family protein n=1 Tax=Sphingomonas sp. DT-204 TaxID=3396166 RepID=UPI003F1A7518
MSEPVTGGCQCGAKRYRAMIDDDEAYLCHCRMCQRATGGVSIAFKNVMKADVEWTGEEPDRYASSSFAKRGFCARCGTPLTYESDGHDRMDLTVGSFDDPSRFRPVSHSGVESWHPQWLDTSHLPTERTEDNPRIAARWMESLGRVP